MGFLTFVEAAGARRRGFTFPGVGFPRFQEWSVERCFYLNSLKRVNIIFPSSLRTRRRWTARAQNDDGTNHEKPE
jgi:hypothetical protein